MKTNYYGSFSLHGGDLFRWDTRVYLDDGKYNQWQGNCVGAVVGVNPGSALPLTSGWGPIDKGVDNTLPNILGIFNKAYKHPHYAGSGKPVHAFVQILNLFYLRDPDPELATAKILQYRQPPVCSAESNSFPVVWFAWGDTDKTLDGFKNRYAKMTASHCFYHNGDTGPIVATFPTLNDHARHPLYLSHDTVVSHLATILA